MVIYSSLDDGEIRYELMQSCTKLVSSSSVGAVTDLDLFNRPLAKIVLHSWGKG